MANPYPSLILKHARLETFRGTLDGAIVHRAVNRPCGDWVKIYLREVDGKCQLRFEGEGCALALGTASAFCEALEGLDLKTIEHHTASFLATFRVEASDACEGITLLDASTWPHHPLAALQPLYELKARRGCVALASRVIRDALRTIRSGGPDESRGSVQR